MFNATGSGQNVIVEAIYAQPKTDVAVTGAVSARFDISRTSSAGTSGTSVPYATATVTGSTIAPLDSRSPDLSTVTARIAPTAGATITTFLTYTYVFPEETNAAAFATNNINILRENAPIILHPGQGLLIQQDTVASVNSYSFQIIFSLENDDAS